MELYVGVIGIIGVVFVVIFGGRGLIDLVRGYSERRRARLSAADDSPSVGAATTATTIAEEQRESAGPTPAVPLVEPDPVYRRTFVGRDAELQQLHDAFDEALAGHGSLAMVVGEPGIGKTSLCEQLAAYVAEQGGKTLVGHCYEEGSLSLPYLAFVEAVRSHVLVLEPDDLKAQLAQGADELARIVPEIRGRMQIEPRPPGDPEEDRYRLLQAASDFLRNAAADQPLLVVLEDLHDADRGTLDMLTHLARNLSGSRLMVLGTYRDVQVDRAHALSSALAELRRVTSFERIALRGLTQDEVHRMLEAIAGHEVPWRWAEVVHRQTEGNPLFVQEVMRYLVEEGVLARDDSEVEHVGDETLAGKIPEGLRDVIGKRMMRLSTRCNQVLAIAAVVGRDFRLDVLQRVASLPEEELFTALEEAKGVGVIEERAAVGTGVSYRFAHAFFRQTLYEEMFAPRRIRFHQQVGRVLEEVHAQRPEEHAAELAEHFAQSTEREDLDKALAYSEMAAQRSMVVYAYGEAVRLLEQALQVQEVLDPGEGARRCDLLLELGDALGPAGEAERAHKEVAEESYHLAVSLGDQLRASRSCRQAVDAMGRSGGAQAWLTAEWREWATRADQNALPASVDRVDADIALALAQRGQEDVEGWLAYANHGYDLARELGDSDAIFRAGQILLMAATPKTWHKAHDVALVLEAIPLERIPASSFGRVSDVVGRVRLAWGDRDAAVRSWAKIADLAERSQDPVLVIRSRSVSGRQATLDGRLEEAAQIGAHIKELGVQLGSQGFGEQNQAGVAYRPLMYLGLHDEARALVASLPFGDSRLMLALARSARKDEAQRMLDQAIDSIRTTGLDTPLGVLVQTLETANVLGVVEEPALLDHVTPFAGYMQTDYFDMTCIARHLGDASLQSGRIGEARGFYEQAVVVCTAVRHRPELALARLGLAELLLDHYPNERAEAIEHLDFAIAEFREMKMQPSLERALALRP